MPTGKNTRVSNQWSSNHPAPPHTAIPEIIVPMDKDVIKEKEPDLSAFELKPGASIRVIREPYFGLLATVTELPAQLMVVDSGTEVRVLKAKLEDGKEVLVPRANVEIVRSWTDGAASSPYSSARSTASRCFRSGMSASRRMFRIPW